MTEELYKEMAQSIIDGEAEQAVALAKRSVELQMHPLDTITKGFVVGVNYIGDQFGKGEAFLPELFEAFKQESRGNARAYEGNGLGLAITKQLVDLMGGTIEVQSQKDAGTTFTLLFPTPAAQPAEVGV